MIFVLLRNIQRKKESISLLKIILNNCVHFFTLSLFLFLAIIIPSVKLGSINKQNVESSAGIVSFTNEIVTFEGYITNESVIKHRYLEMQASLLEDINLNGQTLGKDHGYILIKTENYEKFKIGQVCKFTGILVEPENFSDFDYKTYLMNKQIFLIMENPLFECANIARRRAGSGIKNFLIDFKQSIIKNIDKIMLEPQASLLVGILFGSDRLFSSDFEESIRISGVSHIVAASGYNITILVIFINKLFLFLPKKIRIIFSLIVIWLFAILSGFSASIVRACIMSSISLFSLFWGRVNSMHISLPLASAIFIFLDPLIIHDVGFILSVSATLGLVYISPLLIDMRKRLLKKLKFLDEYVIPTMSCTLSTLPISLITFKTFSIWSVAVNALVLPVIEGTMLWGVLFLLIYSIHPPLSYLCISIANLQLKYFEYIVNIVGDLNIGSWEISNGLANLISISLLIFLILFIIYYYPVENEKYNYYLKDR
jgi:competence protein ComEC